jgi:hypothetical protein
VAGGRGVDVTSGLVGIGVDVRGRLDGGGVDAGNVAVRT